MRSFFYTLLLLLGTAVLGVLASWQFIEGNLNVIIGTPPTEVGAKIYPDFQPESVTSISIKTEETKASFIKTDTGWLATEPWDDRMDPRAAISILTFANTAIAIDAVPRDELDAKLAGLNGGNIEIRLRDENGETLAMFRLGRRTPLLHLPEVENPEPIPTTYLLPLERGRKSHVYAATGDILPLFKDGFTYLRDHRPFYFNPLGTQKIRLRTAQGELTLARETPTSAWRITKPLDLSTDPTAVKTLLEGLVNLQAITVSDRAQVTLPTNGTSPQNDQIAITPFGSTTETILDILPPATPDAAETRATVSDRPDTIFNLPLKSEPTLVSIPDLPLTVNDLRDPTLTNLNIASIRGIAIESATSPTILISRQPPAPWIATIKRTEQRANEQRLYELLKAITTTRAIAFETDAAPEDLSPWGLDKPILRLIFLAQNNLSLSVIFGLDKDGNLFAKRKDNASIMRLDNRILDQIATNPHDWRHSLLWSVSSVDLKSITRITDQSPPIKLDYDWDDEEWTAHSGETDVTEELDPARAKYLLGALENLQVSRWLSPTDETALAALVEPSLIFQVEVKIVDEFGDDTKKTITRALALGIDPVSKIIYGKHSDDTALFTLSPETFIKLSIPLLDQ
ncbi:MAG: DUF4340 domain-containing protein [Akkermansiaceae bacterium]|nr:DUF4340 domain-containing protein [Akkermansiaceae bacterium]MDP4719819.1 DUF4340 domain-containing protein [Akkermansiaceae bacterium]MDP4780982.1 DUF4340 domain-containing protein [Akkermansiaceae bacterium]MDP4846823.1 DUF4340 domain-containing protein [Akkermansiaceae bacterium]MDP4897358.1 DUF4340 domain-containing protein [Akkermansiaceae bacterium]